MKPPDEKGAEPRSRRAEQTDALTLSARRAAVNEIGRSDGQVTRACQPFPGRDTWDNEIAAAETAAVGGEA